MRQMRHAGLALLVLAVSSASVGAQAKGKVEVGADVAGFTRTTMDVASGSASSTNIGLNSGTTVRVGKMVTDKIQVEPNVSFGTSSSKFGTSESSSTYTELGVAALFIFKAMEESKPGWYAKGEVAMSMSKAESGGSTVFDETRTHFGGAAGMKRKAMGVIWRAEAFVKMTPKKGTSVAETDMGLKVGGGFIPQ